MSDNAISGTFGATGQSSTISIYGSASVLIADGSGTVVIQRSTDKGSNWYDVAKNSSGDIASYDPSTGDKNVFIDEPERGVIYRLDCRAYVSGTIVWRVGPAR